MRVAHSVDIFGDPEQSIEVAQAALALLHIGLDHIARSADALEAGVAFGEFGRHEFARGMGDDFLVEAFAQFVEQRAFAQDEARFQQGRADRHVRLGLAQAFVDRTRGVADLLAQVPQDVEHRLDDFLHPGRLTAGQQEQEVDVGSRREQAAPIAADRHHGKARRRCGFARAESA